MDIFIGITVQHDGEESEAQLMPLTNFYFTAGPTAT